MDIQSGQTLEVDSGSDGTGTTIRVNGPISINGTMDIVPRASETASHAANHSGSNGASGTLDYAFDEIQTLIHSLEKMEEMVVR